MEKKEPKRWKRSLVYPKLRIQLSIDTIRKFTGYISVKTRLCGSSFDVGRTETKSKPFGEGILIKFHEVFEIPLEVCVDDLQEVSFQVYDGDLLQTGEGFLLCTIKTLLAQINEQELRLVMMRGDQFLGNIIISNSLDLDLQVPNLQQVDRARVKKSSEFTTVKSLLTSSFFNKAVMGYFPYEVPTLESLKKRCSSLPYKMVAYVFSLEAKNICPFDAGFMTNKEATMHVKIFLEEISNAAEKKFSVDSLWTSISVFRQPYVVEVLEIRFTHEELTRSQGLDEPVSETLHLVFKVYASNIEHHPLLISSCRVPVIDIVKGSHKKRGKTISMDFILEKGALSLIREANSNDSRTSKGWMQKISFGKKTAEESDEFERIGFEEELNRIAPPLLSGKSGKDSSRLSEGDDAERIGDNIATQGTLTLKIKYSVPSDTSVTNGDKIYEKMIQEEFEKECKRWVISAYDSFDSLTEDHSRSTMFATTIFDALLSGLRIVPHVVVDLQFPCLQYLWFKVNNKDDSSYSFTPSSRTIDALECLYDSLGLYCQQREMRVFAGGGVSAPPKVYTDDLSHEEKRHWAFGLSRKIGFPLCEEIGLESVSELAEDWSNPSFRLRKVLEIEDDFFGWGGYSFAENCQYRSKSDLMQGAFESCALYHPYVSGFDPDKSIFPVSKKEQDLIKNRTLAAHNAGSECKTGYEFWKSIPAGFFCQENYNKDINAIESLLEKKSSASTLNTVVWILGKPCPELHRIETLFRNQLKKKDNSAPLLVILAAERIVDFDSQDSRIVAATAEPFAPLIECYQSIVRERVTKFRGKHSNLKSTFEESVERYRHPLLRICHMVSWPEILSSAFMLEDESPRSGSDGYFMPTYYSIYQVLIKKYKLSESISRRVVGIPETKVLKKEADNELSPDVELKQGGKLSQVVDGFLKSKFLKDSWDAEKVKILRTEVKSFLSEAIQHTQSALSSIERPRTARKETSCLSCLTS